MKRFVQGVITALVTIVLIAGLSGCKKEGPIEKAGKQADKAIEKAGETVKDAVK